MNATRRSRRRLADASAGRSAAGVDRLGFFIAYRGVNDLKKLKKDLDAEVDRMGGIDHISRGKLIQHYIAQDSNEFELIRETFCRIGRDHQGKIHHIR